MNKDDLKIVAVGVGKAGLNRVSRLKKMGVSSVKTIGLDTDNATLQKADVDQAIALGEALHFQGTGGFVELGNQCAQNNKDPIVSALKGNHIVFLVAGLGGGTGSGALPAIAKYAQDNNQTTVAIVTTPFAGERARIPKAIEALTKLKDTCDTVIVLDNNRMVKFMPNLPVDETFLIMDQLIADLIRSIADFMLRPSLAKIETEDCMAIFTNGGFGTVLYGEASAQFPSEIVYEVLNHPLLDVPFENINRAIILMRGGPSLDLKTASQIGRRLLHELQLTENVAMGASNESKIENRVKLILVATGITPDVILSQLKKPVPIHPLEYGEVRRSPEMADESGTSGSAVEAASTANAVQSHDAAPAPGEQEAAPAGWNFHDFEEQQMRSEKIQMAQEEKVAKLEKQVEELSAGMEKLQEEFYIDLESEVMMSFLFSFAAIDMESKTIAALGKTPAEAVKKAKAKQDKTYYIRRINDLVLAGYTVPK